MILARESGNEASDWCRATSSPRDLVQETLPKLHLLIVICHVKIVPPCISAAGSTPFFHSANFRSSIAYIANFMLGPPSNVESGSASGLHFSVADKWGQLVEVTVDRWNHVILRHPEMTGEEERVKQAIHTPQIVYEGDTANDRMFRGDRIAGSGFRLGGKVIIAVVNYAGSAKFLTAYSTTLDPNRRVLWNRAP
jgi:hypothetical protein